MRLTVRKFFTDYEKEEQWLNEMSAKGYALTEYSWARYVFDESGKGEYIFRIELLEDMQNEERTADYLRFMKELGAERVAVKSRWIASANNRWVVYRRKASEGPFAVYSDTDSKIKHYQRIQRLWIISALLELFLGVLNTGLAALNHQYALSSINLILGVLLILLGVAFLLCSLPVRRKISKLSSDRLIRE